MSTMKIYVIWTRTTKAPMTVYEVMSAFIKEILFSEYHGIRSGEVGVAEKKES